MVAALDRAPFPYDKTSLHVKLVSVYAVSIRKSSHVLFQCHRWRGAGFRFSGIGTHHLGCSVGPATLDMAAWAPICYRTGPIT